MKELFLRLRHWLIEALGGYTRQQIIVQRVTHPPAFTSPLTVVQAVHMVFPHDLQYGMVGHRRSEEEMFLFIKRELTRALSEELMKSQMVLWECSDDPLCDARMYRARITVIDPKITQIFR